MSRRAKLALTSGLGLIALTATYLTEPWEGTKNLAYWDSLGRVWTVCTGETKGVKKGDRYSDRECADKLYTTLEQDYHRPLVKCIPGFDAKPLGWQAAMLDLTYNIGAGAACKSTAARRAKAGNLKGSCEAMTWYNKAGGKVVRGLKLRRGYGDENRIGELEICLAGLDTFVPVPKSDVPVPKVGPVPAEKPAGSGQEPPVVATRENPAPWGAILAALVCAALVAGFIVWRKRRGGKT